MARKSSSLGPFPKTRRWREIVGSADVADRILGKARRRLGGLLEEDATTSVAVFFAAVPIASRSPHAAEVLQAEFGIPNRTVLRDSLAEVAGEEGLLRRAALAAFDELVASPRFTQARMDADPLLPWRELDGSAFCEVGRLLFAHLAAEVLLYYTRTEGLKIDEAAVRRHAWELSLITKAFTARWYNACAVGQIPSRSNVRWYVGHCLGKLDMELERELSTHIEPLPNPFKRRKKLEPPSLGLPLFQDQAIGPPAHTQ